MSYADEPIHARILALGDREGESHHSYKAKAGEGESHHGYKAKAGGRDHLRVRRVSPDMRHLAATVHAVKDEAFAGPARR